MCLGIPGLSVARGLQAAGQVSPGDCSTPTCDGGTLQEAIGLLKLSVIVYYMISVGKKLNHCHCSTQTYDGKTMVWTWISSNYVLVLKMVQATLSSDLQTTTFFFNG